MPDAKGFVTSVITALNAINEDVWGVLLIVLGASLLIACACLHAEHSDLIIGGASSIVGAGAMAFKGGRSS